jgi:hypothetical protein
MTIQQKQSSYPKIVEKFFSNNYTHLKNKFKSFDIENLPWLILSKKFDRCYELLQTVLKKTKPCYRYDGRTIIEQDATKLLKPEWLKLKSYIILTPSDPKTYEKYLQDDDNFFLNQQQYNVVEELKNSTEVQELLNFLPIKKFYNVFITELMPGGYLSPHIDTNYGKWKSGLRDQITIPLNDCPGAEFKFYGCGTVPLSQIGVPLLLNTNRYIHAIKNDSTISRFHLKIQGDFNTPEMLELMEKSFYVQSKLSN